MSAVLPLELSTYHSIYESISDALDKYSARLDFACAYYANCGATILKDLFDINAVAKSGIAAYALSEDDVFYFADRSDYGIACSYEGFHCWIETGEWLIDFMAPRFIAMYEAESGRNVGGELHIQIPLSALADNPSGLLRRGDVCVMDVPEFSQDLSKKILMLDEVVSESLQTHQLKIRRLENGARWKAKP